MIKCRKALGIKRLKKILVKIHKLIKKIIFCMYYKMVFITVEKYSNAGVYTITVDNKKYFWVIMVDEQKGLGLKKILI